VSISGQVPRTCGKLCIKTGGKTKKVLDRYQVFPHTELSLINWGWLKRDSLCRHQEEDKWNEFEMTIKTEITKAKSNAIYRELQLKNELSEVIKKGMDMKLGQKCNVVDEI
jgi:hypothetical protein